jgi:hypothetical protein
VLKVEAGGEAVVIAVPGAVRARAEEIVRLSRRLGERGGGFSSSREVLAPALVYGLAHMQERYRQAAARESRLTALAGVGEREQPEGEDAGPHVGEERERDD